MVRGSARSQYRCDFGDFLYLLGCKEELGGSERGFWPGLEIGVEIAADTVGGVA